MSIFNKKNSQNIFIEVIGTCSKTPKAHFGPSGPLRVHGGDWLLT